VYGIIVTRFVEASKVAGSYTCLLERKDHVNNIQTPDHRRIFTYNRNQ